MLCVFGPLLLTAVAAAQQGSVAPAVPGAAASRKDQGRIVIDVTVTPKSGVPVAGLQQKDFTILDNKAPRTITSFKALGGPSQTEAILIIDAVNASYLSVSYQRDQIKKFLKQNEGQLALPTMLAVLTDNGIQAQQGFSKDGNQISAALDQYVVGLRTIRRSSGFWGAADRLQLSLDSLRNLTTYDGTLPGRKLMIWISPGWPLLSGPGIDLSSHQEQQLFAEVVGMSTQLRLSRTTMYAINPLGPTEGEGRATYYQDFLKGVAKPSDVQAANLSLQVLAAQSGGIVFLSNNDITGMLKDSVQDADVYYELTFDAAPAERANEYHHLEVKVETPGVTVRTRDGYYAQP
jgi:VWFA-related protein